MEKNSIKITPQNNNILRIDSTENTLLSLINSIKSPLALLSNLKGCWRFGTSNCHLVFSNFDFIHILSMSSFNKGDARDVRRFHVRRRMTPREGELLSCPGLTRGGTRTTMALWMSLFIIIIYIIWLKIYTYTTCIHTYVWWFSAPSPFFKLKKKKVGSDIHGFPYGSGRSIFVIQSWGCCKFLTANRRHTTAHSSTVWLVDIILFHYVIRIKIAVLNNNNNKKDVRARFWWCLLQGKINYILVPHICKGLFFVDFFFFVGDGGRLLYAIY